MCGQVCGETSMNNGVKEDHPVFETHSKLNYNSRFQFETYKEPLLTVRVSYF